MTKRHSAHNTCCTQVQVPVPEVSSSLQASVDTASISTPPIDSSTPPSAQQPSAAPQPVQPDSSGDFEVRRRI